MSRNAAWLLARSFNKPQVPVDVELLVKRHGMPLLFFHCYLTYAQGVACEPRGREISETEGVTLHVIGNEAPTPFTLFEYDCWLMIEFPCVCQRRDDHRFNCLEICLSVLVAPLEKMPVIFSMRSKIKQRSEEVAHCRLLIRPGR